MTTRTPRRIAQANGVLLACLLLSVSSPQADPMRPLPDASPASSAVQPGLSDQIGPSMLLDATRTGRDGQPVIGAAVSRHMPMEFVDRRRRDSDGDGISNAADACPETGLNVPVDRLGCTLPQGLLASIRFERADTRLDGLDRQQLTAIAATLRQHADLQLMINGHADGEGAADINRQLSRARAASVARHLERLGVSPGRLHMMAWGETQPLADGRTPEGQQLNRRVEIHSSPIF